MANLSVCESPTCAITVESSATACPKCGGPLREIRESKARAVVLILCGIFLILIMGTVTLFTAPMLLNPGAESEGGSGFTGTVEQARMVLALFAVVIGFGISSLLNGIYMLKTGKQSRAFIVAAIILGLLLLASVWGFMSSVKPEG